MLAVPYGNRNEGEAVRAIAFALRSLDSVSEFLFPSERYKSMMVKGARGANLAPEFVKNLSDSPTCPPVHASVNGITRLTATALFYCWKSKRLAPLVRVYYTPILAQIYSAREREIRSCRPILARIITAGMLLCMLPFTIAGFFRFIYLGRDIQKIFSGR